MKYVAILLNTFLSAFLVFAIQPLLAQIFTPLLGGTPSVWNSLLLLFQALLFLGYAFVGYVYIRFERFSRSAYIGLACLSLLTLFHSYHLSGLEPDYNAPNMWLLLHSALLIGLPFFILSTTAPLLQHLYAKGADATDNGRDPYWLYGLSNLGSFSALLLYPFVIQPAATTQDQLIVWAWFYAFFLGVMTVIFFKSSIRLSFIKEESRPLFKTKLVWALLAFCPASLLHGVTMIITNDISSFPLLWIIPLALYLLSFVLTFHGKSTSVSSARAVACLFSVCALPVLILPLFMSPMESVWILAAHLTCFFVIAVICHRLLYHRRPDRSHLGGFYIWIAAGGCLAGLFNVLIAPYIFDKLYEYPLTILFSCILIFSLLFPRKPLVAVFAVSLLGLGFFGSGLRSDANIYLPDIRSNSNTAKVVRNYFGIIKYEKAYVARHINEYRYYNGFLLHGVDTFDEETKRIIPSSLSYHKPIMENALRLGRPHASLGLGTGTDLCQAPKGAHIDFYEINPDVVRYAKDPAYTKSLDNCEGSYDIIVGDARLELAKKSDGYYGGIVSTVTNSSSVPFHLMTLEAFQIYSDKLAPGGALVFLTPAAYFDFTPLFANYASLLDMQLYSFSTVLGDGVPYRYFLFLKKPYSKAALGENDLWNAVSASPDGKVWRDNYYNLWQVL